MMYDENMVRPMREVMTDVGFQEARSAEDVDRVFSEEGTTLFFINSVCGCAAGVARPGVLASLHHSILPNKLVTAFAGNDVEAVDRVREHFAGYPPSSPCAAILRDGRVMHMVERHHIEGQSAENVARILKSAYDKYFGEEIDDSVEIFDPVATLQISQGEARERLATSGDIAVLDVRESWEIRAGKIEGASKSIGTRHRKSSRLGRATARLSSTASTGSAASRPPSSSRTTVSRRSRAWLVATPPGQPPREAQRFAIGYGLRCKV